MEEVDFWLHKRHFFRFMERKVRARVLVALRRKQLLLYTESTAELRSRLWKFKNESRTISTDMLYSGWGYIQNRRCLFTNLSAVVDQNGEEERRGNWASSKCHLDDCIPTVEPPSAVHQCIERASLRDASCLYGWRLFRFECHHEFTRHKVRWCSYWLEIFFAVYTCLRGGEMCVPPIIIS